MYSLQFSVILSTSYDTIPILSQKCNLTFKFERLLINVPKYTVLVVYNNFSVCFLEESSHISLMVCMLNLIGRSGQ